MLKEKTTIENLGVAVKDLTTTVKGLEVTVGGLVVTVEGLGITMEGLAVTVEGLGANMEKLAQMTQQGFLETASKADLALLTERLENFEKYTEKRFDTVDIELTALRSDIERLARSENVTEHDVQKLEKRVSRLEKKAGVKSVV